MSKPKLLYYDVLQYQDSTLEKMHHVFHVISLPDPINNTEAILREISAIIIPRGFYFDKIKIDNCPNLQVIGSSTLSIPNIDSEYAISKGIKICYLGNQERFLRTITPTVDITWGLILALTRKVPWAHKSVCRGEWEGRSFGRTTPKMLSSMTLGIVGLGRLGSLVASCGKGFGMKAYYYSPSSRNATYERCINLLELATYSDIVSIHAHHTPETERLINVEFFQAMRPGSFIVNTSRGELIDEIALLDALKSGHLGGAALDVLSGELEIDFCDKLKDNPLVSYAKSHDNLIITPHYGGATVDARLKTETKTIDLISEALTHINN